MCAFLVRHTVEEKVICVQNTNNCIKRWALKLTLSLSVHTYIEICENNNNKQLIKLFSFADSENCRIQLHCIKYNRMCVFRLTSSFLRLPIGWHHFRLSQPSLPFRIHLARLNFIQKAAVQNILQYTSHHNFLNEMNANSNAMVRCECFHEWSIFILRWKYH